MVKELKAKLDLGYIIQKLYHVVTLRINTKECHDNGDDLLCCFVEFRKSFDTNPKTKL